jgi:hypothetical protein
MDHRSQHGVVTVIPARVAYACGVFSKISVSGVAVSEAAQVKITWRGPAKRGWAPGRLIRALLAA